MNDMMTIVFATVQANKTTGNEFVSVHGSAVIDRRLLETELTVDSSTEGYAVFKRIATAYQTAKTANQRENYPRGFAIKAPAGWLVDWDQVREDYEAEGGVMKPGRWVIKPMRNTEIDSAGNPLPSIELTKAPPIKVAADDAAEALMAQYGI